MTQKKWVTDQLKQHGEISRNAALSVRITRLAALINILRSEGWEFETEEREGNYIYKVKDSPKVPVHFVRHPFTGEKISTADYAAL